MTERSPREPSARRRATGPTEPAAAAAGTALAVHPLLEAVRPLADAVGAKLVEVDDLIDGDVELRWKGRLVGGARLAVGVRDISWYVTRVEAEMGTPLVELDRVGKQAAVKALNDIGAFQLRHSVEQVAEMLGVSRFTVYNYLNRPETG